MNTTEKIAAAVTLGLAGYGLYWLAKKEVQQPVASILDIGFAPLTVYGTDAVTADINWLNNLLASGMGVGALVFLGSYNSGTGVFTIESVTVGGLSYLLGSEINVSAPAAGSVGVASPRTYAPNIAVAKTYDIQVVLAPQNSVAFTALTIDYGSGSRTIGMSFTGAQYSALWAFLYSTRVFTGALTVNPTVLKAAVQDLTLLKA